MCSASVVVEAGVRSSSNTVEGFDWPFLTTRTEGAAAPAVPETDALELAGHRLVEIAFPPVAYATCWPSGESATADSSDSEADPIWCRSRTLLQSAASGLVPPPRRSAVR